jgi:hypothetical protein
LQRGITQYHRLYRHTNFAWLQCHLAQSDSMYCYAIATRLFSGTAQYYGLYRHANLAGL